MSIPVRLAHEKLEPRCLLAVVDVFTELPPEPVVDVYGTVDVSPAAPDIGLEFPADVAGISDPRSDFPDTADQECAKVSDINPEDLVQEPARVDEAFDDYSNVEPGYFFHDPTSESTNVDAAFGEDFAVQRLPPGMRSERLGKDRSSS